VIDDESLVKLVKTRTNTCLSYTSTVPSYSVPLLNHSNICQKLVANLGKRTALRVQSKNVHFVKYFNHSISVQSGNIKKFAKT
jgi:hypothetical protein